MAFIDADASKFSQLIAALAVAFGKPADTPLFIAYEMALDDLPLSSIEIAVRRAIRECKFMPTGSELRQLSGEITGSSRALLAYAAASLAAPRFGGYMSVDFSDPLVNAVIRSMGGWDRFCSWETSEIQWRQRDFERHYCALMLSGAGAELVAPLVGIIETANSSRGFLKWIDPPVRISVDLPGHRPGLIRSAVPAIAGPQEGDDQDEDEGTYEIP